MQAYNFVIPYIKNKIILDLGCGSGYGTYYLSTEGAKHIIGIDISKEAIEYCKREYIADNLQYGIMDGSRLGFKDNSFDVIVSFQVIEHIENVDEYLSEVYRATRIFIVSTPNKAILRAKNPFHVTEFNLNELQVLLQSIFHRVNIFGIYPDDKLQNLGNKVAKTEAYIDNLMLRPFIRLIPIRIKRLLSARFFKINDKAFSVSENTSDCLDFIAVCVK